FLTVLIVGCSDDDGNPCLYNPTLTTSAVTNITETSATLNGVISIVSENCDDPNNTEQGFVFATTIQPTIANTKVNVNGTEVTTTLENLEPNTTYYVRSFLTNAFGEFYGNEVSFMTVVDQPCEYNLITLEATDIESSSATLNGTISIDEENCEFPIIEQGFVFSTEVQPTIADTQVNVNGTDVTTTIENLEPNTTYYVRTFLTNNDGEFYGNEVSFMTVVASACEYNLITLEPTIITSNSAILNGTISIELTENCDGSITEQGFVYSTEIQPTIEDTKINVNGTDVSITIENLEPNTTYYARTFLTNALGEFYGNEVSFITIEEGMPEPLNCDGPSGGGAEFYSENFEGFDSIEAYVSAGWTNVNTNGGNEVWEIGNFDNNNYAQVSGFSSGEDIIDTWLVTPAIDMDTTIEEELSFNIQAAFDNGTILSVLVSTDFTGDVTTAAWNLVDASIPTGPESGFGDFSPSGAINISCVDGMAHIAFRYQGSDPTATTRYHIDDIVITGN
ncbi:DUF5017 domain-containing protein, partial [Flavobacteriaceae bacterium]|nr:DUF5017 domain-containing protein [Flavobacteriaceae bacterium]